MAAAVWVLVAIVAVYWALERLMVWLDANNPDGGDE